MKSKRVKMGYPGIYALTFILVCAVAIFSSVRNSTAAFESGSTCGAAFYNSTTCRGAFSPSVNTKVKLPRNGILDYTTVTIPTGVQVSFDQYSSNTNTPVTIRTSGNVSVVGSIWVGYNTSSTPTSSGTAGDGVLGDDGIPGKGGPGGYDGGSGGLGTVLGGIPGNIGGAGKGPGGGQSTVGMVYNGIGFSGGGGGYNGNGGNAYGTGTNSGGTSYGQWSLLPLIGGSGGAGGSAGSTFSGSGGGGGGGAILIASSGTISISGYIYADGGAGGATTGTGSGGAGGGGSGGAIRLIAETLTRSGAGYLYARGGAGTGSDYGGAGAGANGYIRLESNVLTGWTTGYSTPGYSYVLPGEMIVPNSPTLTITSVGAQAVPANPSGVGDITLAQGTATAVVELAATNIPVGTTVTVYSVPAAGGARTSSLSSALAGASDAATTATATVALKDGNNVLLATATYTISLIVGMNMPTFNGEYVAKIRVETELGGKSKTIYITASGKEYPAETKVQKKAV